MTHEYTILRDAIVLAEPIAQALAFAHDTILAVGPEEDVTAISQGDSHELVLSGGLVTPRPTDVRGATVALGRALQVPGPDLRTWLDGPAWAGATPLAVGEPADLAIWSVGASDGPRRVRLEAMVCAGVLILRSDLRAGRGAGIVGSSPGPVAYDGLDESGGAADGRSQALFEEMSHGRPDLHGNHG